MALNSPLQYAAISTAASGATALVTAAAGLKIRVVSYAIVSTAANSVKFQSGSTDITGAMALAANGGVSCVGSPVSPLFETASGAALNINLSGATQISGHIAYFEE